MTTIKYNPEPGIAATIEHETERGIEIITIPPRNCHMNDLHIALAKEHTDIGAILPNRRIKVIVVDGDIDWKLQHLNRDGCSHAHGTITLPPRMYDEYNRLCKEELVSIHNRIFTIKPLPEFKEPTLIGNIGIRPYNRTRKQIRKRYINKLKKKRLL